MTIAVYAGSFDPITLGHLDLILRAGKSFKTLIVAVGINSNKAPRFTTEERIDLIKVAIEDELQTETRAKGGDFEDRPNIQVTSFSGLLVDFCKANEATVIVRGLRAITDFEAELGIAHTNGCLNPKIDTFFLPTKPKFSFVSSSTVKELAKHTSETSWSTMLNYVPPNVLEALKAKFHPAGLGWCR